MRKSRSKQEKEVSLAGAFSNLSDGVVTLVRQHLDLFKEEAKRDVKLSVSQYTRVALGAGILLLGWIFLNATIVLGVGAWFGMKSGFLVALVTSILHLILGGYLVRAATGEMKNNEGHLRLAKLELEQSSKWVKQIKKEKPMQKLLSKDTETIKSNKSEPPSN